MIAAVSPAATVFVMGIGALGRARVYVHAPSMAAGFVDATGRLQLIFRECRGKVGSSMTDASADEYVFSVVASPDDIDELGHVSNVVYVRWVQDAAKAHSEAVGWDRAAYLRAGAVFVVRRHEIDYLAPVFAGDRIAAHTHVARFGAATSERKTRLVRESDGALVARAVTSWAFVAITTQRPTRIPHEIRDAFPAALPRGGA